MIQVAEERGIKRRQRYKCTPVDGSPVHCFTPPLPRLAVDFGTEHCPECSELTGVHHGQQSSARANSALLHIVVDALLEVAAGTSYTAASSKARKRMGSYKERTKPAKKGPTRTYHKTPKTKPEPDPDTPAPASTKPVHTRSKNVSGKEARKHWRLAADWTEIYSPVIWEQAEAQMREVEHAQMLTPDPKRPSVLILDGIPVKSKRGRAGSKQLWAVLAAASVVWDEQYDSRKETRLRLVRAMPAENALTWRLFLDELSPFVPEYVVADTGRGQLGAIKSLWRNTIIIPSVYHLISNLEDDLKTLRNTRVKNEHGITEFHPSITKHLRSFAGHNLVNWDITDFNQWWDELCLIVTSLGGGTRKLRARQKRLSPDFAIILPELNKLPELPLSTGALEMLMDTRIKPLLDRRAHGFGNLERTNRLFDLCVAKDRGWFDDRHAVTALIQADNEANGGWSRQPRQVVDRMPVDPATGLRMPVSSLLDYSTVTALAIKKGLL